MSKDGFKGKGRPGRQKKPERKPEEFVEEQPLPGGAPATPPEKSEETEYLHRVAFKDLNFTGVISTKSDPQATADHAATPYPYTNKTNRVYEADYPGDDNLDGNIVVQIMTNEDSKLLNLFDCGDLEIKVNYLYQAIKNSDHNKALNAEIATTINEALSSTYSEMLTQLPFFTDVVESDMPNIDANKRQAWLTYYQAVLQNVATVCGRYNNLRCYKQRLIDMGYRRESVFTRDLFTQLEKKTFNANLESLGALIVGEYFDWDWNKQMNILQMVPSRKATSMLEPMLNITAIHRLPNLKITTANAGSTIFDSAAMKIKPTGETKTYTLEELFAEICRELNPYRVLKWARQYKAGADSRTSKQVANRIEYLLQALKVLLTQFNDSMGDIRTVLDRAGKIGLNYWRTGARFVLEKYPEAQFMYNKLVADIFSAYASSADAMLFDENIKRWRFFTLWDKYTGIPKYDKINGGAFITMSVRNLEPVANDENFLAPKWLVPKLFNTVDGTMKFVNRIGFETEITKTIYSNEQLNADPVFSRLNPLSVPDLKVRMATGSVLKSGNIPAAASSLSLLIDTVFGFGQVETEAGRYDKNLDSQALFFVDAQLSDVSNAMISYARAFAPFRVEVLEGDRTMGFRK